MRYYKLINGENFIGVGTTWDFRRYQNKHGILISCDENTAEYMRVGDELYRDDRWMIPPVKTSGNIPYKTATITEIDGKEYDSLIKSIETGEEINLPPVTPPREEPEEVVISPDIEYVRKVKIKELENDCNKAITNGFDVVLSDGASHHFSLSPEDQLNIIRMVAVVDKKNEFWFHGDGEPDAPYKPGDVEKIYQMYDELVYGSRQKFRQLKNAVMKMDDVTQIEKIRYK